MMQNIVIFLTACVNPHGMSNTLLVDPTVRLKQYLDAINFYIKHTDNNIVIVENSGYDLSRHFPSSKRTEFLSFDGNNYDKKLGKGYGEALIVEYALNNSFLLKKASAICKITGRNIVRDISKRVMMYESHVSQVIAMLDVKRKFLTAKCICCPTIFWTDYFLPNKQLINDSEHIFFENILYQSLKKWLTDGRELDWIILPIPVDGISGTSGKSVTVSLFNYCKMICSSSISFLFYKLFNKI